MAEYKDESTKVNDRKKETTKCLDRDIVCTIVFFIPFSNH